MYMYRRSGSADLPAIQTGVNGIYPALLQVEEALCTMALWGGGGTMWGHFSTATHHVVLLWFLPHIFILIEY